MALGLIGHSYVALGTTAIAFAVSVYQGTCSIWALFPLLGLAALLMARPRVNSSFAKGALTVGSALLAVTIGMHLFPGFGYVNLGTTQFGQSSTDYQFAAGIDKWAVGAIILAFASSLTFKGNPTISKCGIAVTMITPPALIILGIILGVPIDVKFGPAVLAFVGMNLVVCAVEEGFYRLLVQERLTTVFPGWAALLIASVIFFATHFSPNASLSTMIIFAVAGGMYAAAYQLTRSIWVAIGVHWASNTLHILILQYPLS